MDKLFSFINKLTALALLLGLVARIDLNTLTETFGPLFALAVTFGVYSLMLQIVLDVIMALVSRNKIYL